MEKRILLEEIKTILNGRDDFINLISENNRKTPYPDILPTILHKLKNKLTPILGYSQILLMKNPEDSIKNKIDSIERNASELTKLFDNLKDSLSIPETVLEMCNINSLILNEKRFFDKIVESGIKIFLDFDVEIPHSYFNLRMISLLVQNTVENSVSAINRKNISNGEIRIKTAIDKDKILLKIRDNGIGIDKSEIINIWTPFYSKFPGKSGIGLLVVEKAVTNHKGTFSVESAKGKFAEFIFSFPVIKEKQDRKKGSDTGDIRELLFIGFGESKVTLIKEILEEKNDLKINKSDIDNIRNLKIPKSGYDIIFVNIENEDIKLPEKFTEIFPGSKIFFLYSGEITGNLKLFINKKDTRFLSTKNKIFTTISIIANIANKEES